MKSGLALVFLLIMANFANAYGIRSEADNDPAYMKSLFLATVAIVNKAEFDNADIPRFSDRYNLCLPSGFESETLWSMCSGVLIADNKILTAGHCIDESTCSSKLFIFDYNNNNSISLIRENADKVYRCKKVLTHSHPVPQKQLIDYAVIELDRSVIDRKPIPLAKNTQLTTSRVYGFGHPLGLPKKVTEGFVAEDQKKFNKNKNSPFYKISMNSFAGISGGPLVDEFGKLVGLIVRGDGNLEYDKICAYIKPCEENNCPESQIQKIDNLFKMAR